MIEPNRYQGKSVLITGHTGFKGSWLALWLAELGARIAGLALSPESSPNHWELLGLNVEDNRADIREFARVLSIFEQAQPQIVFHLAAQPLVRRSYLNPLETWSTNVMGTANILESCRRTASVRAIVIVTTDKVYANREWPWGYRENDRLGGHDPYSASKAASELVAESYRSAFFNTDQSALLATARGGNVIGGGDWSEDRLIPDLVRAASHSRPAEIRYPQSTRPWQHVLDCLNGYLLLGQELLKGNRDFAEAWNFGPDSKDNLMVAEILTRLKNYWPNLDWLQTKESQPHEANFLYLDSAKSKTHLGWRPVWNLELGLESTAKWYRHYFATGESLSRQQLDDFLQAASKAGLQCAGK
jgi:CDP-glucose 4,6-dehydratase